MVYKQLDLVQYLEQTEGDRPNQEIQEIDFLDYLKGEGVPYIDQFQIGDRVKFREGYRTNWEAELTTGTIAQISENNFQVFWDGCDHSHLYDKFHIAHKQWWIKFLEKPQPDNFPEILEPIPTHGYVEDYFVIGKNKKAYFYTRYVYQDISGKLRHHHIPKKQRDAISALWRSGAIAKEICHAIGKKYLGKDSA